MEKNQIFKIIQEVFRDVLDNDDIMLEEQMTAKDIDGWTSLTQAQILTSIEKRFGVRFSLMEIIEMKSVGQIIDSVTTKV